jgi:hypothetical protein
MTGARMAREVEGLKSEALRAALAQALAGDSERLAELLARHGALPSPRPNLKLAQAFGTELSSLPGVAAPLLSQLCEFDTGDLDARAFLPIAAAHGWGGRIRAGREIGPAWAALQELSADPRGPVRLGTLDALVGLAAREGGADELVRQALDWLESADLRGSGRAHGEDRELCFGAAALVVEALGQSRALSGLRDVEGLLAYLSALLERIGSAPRAAERSEGRRRVLTSLASALPVVVSTLRAGERGNTWFLAECERAAHPDLRRMLSDCIVKLHAQGGQAGAAPLRQALEASAKPVRDPTLKRKGTGRGKQTRRTR